jgi:hypothetical protein
VFYIVSSLPTCRILSGLRRPVCAQLAQRASVRASAAQVGGHASCIVVASGFGRAMIRLPGLKSMRQKASRVLRSNYYSFGAFFTTSFTRKLQEPTLPQDALRLATSKKQIEQKKNGLKQIAMPNGAVVTFGSCFCPCRIPRALPAYLQGHGNIHQAHVTVVPVVHCCCCSSVNRTLPRLIQGKELLKVSDLLGMLF